MHAMMRLRLWPFSPRFANGISPLIADLRLRISDKSLNHPERGDMTLRVVVETMAGHDLNHLLQVEALAA